jgi:polyisoprenoid-binding protein YceI
MNSENPQSIWAGLNEVGANAMNNWKVTDENYTIDLIGTKFHGSLTGLKAEIYFDPVHPQLSRFSASVDVKTLKTGFLIKTMHALSQKALDAKNFPVIKFQSDTVIKKGNSYEADGTLTLKGISKGVIISFTYTGNHLTGIFKGNFKVNPKEHNHTRHGVPDEINVKLEIPVSH